MGKQQILLKQWFEVLNDNAIQKAKNNGKKMCVLLNNFIKMFINLVVMLQEGRIYINSWVCWKKVWRRKMDQIHGEGERMVTSILCLF